MRTFSCECGCKKFNVNRDKAMAKCWACGQKHVFKERKWAKLDLKERVVEFARSIVHKPVEVAEETLGQLRKRLGVAKEKKPAVERSEVALFPSKRLWGFDPLHKIKKKWGCYYFSLETLHKIDIGCNEHFGKLRGRDIAKGLHRDLSRVGIKTRLHWIENRGARLELEGN